MQVNCPKCEADVSDSYEPDDWSVGIVGGWYCDACDLGIGEDEVDRHSDSDVGIPTVAEVRGDKPLGTPISQLRGIPEYPGDPRYAEFCRIAKSWGHD